MARELTITVDMQTGAATSNARQLDTALDGLERKAGTSTNAAMQKLDGTTQTLGGRFMSMAASVGAGMIAAGVAERAFSFLATTVANGVDAAAEAEMAQVKLATALRNSGAPVQQNITAFNALASELQRTTVFEDDATVAVMALATEMGVLPSEMSTVIRLSADMTAAWGGSLQGNMEAIVKGGEGMTRMLKAHNVELDANRVKQEGVTYVMSVLATHFNENATADIDTYAGRLAQLKNEWSALGEALGGVVLQFGRTTGAMALLTDAMRGVNELLVGGKFAWLGLAEASRDGAHGIASYLLTLGRVPPATAKVADGNATARREQKAFDDQISQASVSAWNALGDATKAYERDQEKATAAVKKAAAAFKVLKDAEDAMSGRSLITDTNILIATYERLVAQGLKPTKEQQDKIAASIEKATAAARETGQTVPAEWNKIWIATKDFTQETSLAALSMEDIAKQGRVLSAEVLPTTGIAIAGVGAMMEQAARRAAELKAANEAVRKKYGDLAIGLPAVVQGMDIVEKSMEAAAEAAREKLARSLIVAANWFDSLARTASLAGHNTIATVLSIGAQTVDNMRKAEGAVMKAAAALDGLAEVAAATGHKTTSAVLSIASNTAKAFAQGGPWAAAMAFGVSVVTAFADKIFKLEGKKVNDLRDSFFAAAGGFEELHKKLIAAGADATFTKLWTAGTVKDWEAAVKDADAALGKLAATQAELADLQQQLTDRSVMNWEKAESIAAKYGGTLASLGPQFEAAKLHDGFLEMLNDFEDLRDMGAGVGAITVLMKDRLNAFVLDARRLGTDVPEQFKPMIQQLIESKQLFDENGQLISDISAIKFGAPLVSEVDKIIAKIDELVQALANNLLPRIDQIPRHVTIDVGYTYQDYVPPGEGGGGEEGGATPPAYHAGGLVVASSATSTVPAWAPRFHRGGEVPAMLQAGEYVMSRSAVSRLGAATLAAMNRGRAAGPGAGSGGASAADIRAAVAAGISEGIRSHSHTIQMDGTNVALAVSRHQPRIARAYTGRG